MFTLHSIFPPRFLFPWICFTIYSWVWKILIKRNRDNLFYFSLNASAGGTRQILPYDWFQEREVFSHSGRYTLRDESKTTSIVSLQFLKMNSLVTEILQFRTPVAKKNSTLFQLSCPSLHFVYAEGIKTWHKKAWIKTTISEQTILLLVKKSASHPVSLQASQPVGW